MYFYIISMDTRVHIHTFQCTSIHSNAVLCRPSSLDPSCNIALESVNIIILAYDVSGVKLIGKLVQTYKYVPHLL